MGQLTGFAFDYFLKDHLGNVRTVITDELQQDVYPAATLEGDTGNTAHPITLERGYYSINPSQVVPRSSISGLPNYPNHNGNPPVNNNPNCSNTSAIKQTDNSDKLYRMNSSNTAKTGLGITLKVMAGDKIDIFGRSYYKQGNSGGSAVNTNIPVPDLINGLLQGGSPAAGKATAAEINSIAGGDITNFLQQPGRDNPNAATRPRAFINYILLDDQFKFAGGSFSRVSNVTDSLKQHFNDAALQNIPVSKNGYLYVYVSNESPVNVFFDNLQVIHNRGALLEETHYYPFGLTMAGISSRAAGKVENRYKFNDGTELNTDFGIGLYETAFRLYDAQTGRFTQIDELADEFEDWSPFIFANDNPILLNDPLGLAADSNWVPMRGVTVTAERKAGGVYRMINHPGISLQKNPNYNEWSEDPYIRQKYIYYRVWTPSSDKTVNRDAEMLEAFNEVATWVIPWGKLGKPLKWIFRLRKVKQIAAFAKLAFASKYGIKSYKALKALNTTANTQVHHLIEQRFAQRLGTKADDMLSIVLTKEEHQVFTNAWRTEIGYEGSKAAVTTLKASQGQVEAAARRIYQDYPEILRALGL